MLPNRNQGRQGTKDNGNGKTQIPFSINQDLPNLKQNTNLFSYSCSSLTINNRERKKGRVREGLYYLILQRSPISVAGTAAQRARSDFSDSSSFFLAGLDEYLYMTYTCQDIFNLSLFAHTSYLRRRSFWSFFSSFLRPKFAIGPKRFQSHQPEIIPALPLSFSISNALFGMGKLCCLVLLAGTNNDRTTSTRRHPLP